MMLQQKHVAILAGFLLSLGTSIAGVKSGWSEVLTPTFIGGLCGQIGSLIVAIYSCPPDASGGASTLGSIDPRKLAVQPPADPHDTFRGV